MPTDNNFHNNQNERPAGLFRDRHITTDPAAPVLYSRYTIRFFAIFCSTFLGGILMAMNLHRLKKRMELFLVLLFSFLFTVAGVVLYTTYGSKSANILIIANLIGSLILEELYWNRVIGKEFMYKKRQVWPLVLLVILLSVPVALSAL